MLKEHLEFFALDFSVGWETPPGYPAGIEQKILAGSLDEENKKDPEPACCVFNPAPSPPCRLSTITGKKFFWYPER